MELLDSPPPVNPSTKGKELAKSTAPHGKVFISMSDEVMKNTKATSKHHPRPILQPNKRTEHPSDS
ncbi:hypothetical protein BS47DRAFT_1391267 [Hydnum rufescens UP504]|uniref:Uncharacterized protein n=1 Tax=Hydnum rufescens UP504 TaxID=1448309 RepID=A0A9P6DZA1_9AGAM|nr:hypothetical protein BS47DRAFT_1391267 [Hydnum rufescens UP504]